ncbi:radical SAM protein [Sulfolobus tengchongensis]|uniref:Radical SAM protein n=1 Tax=Sulfolobus tengchongensis TaxID=207809 RepID=A0AAX4KXZ5_9CREN
MIIKYIKVKTALSKSGLKELDYSLNPYLGCAFSCPYCYAPMFTPNEEASENWGKVIVVKENLLDVLKKEVKTIRKGVVGVSTITDPYQPVEAIKKLTRESVNLLLENGFRVSIQTKSPLVIRDLDIFLKYKNKVDIGFTVTSLESQLEPNAPPPKARIMALRKLSENGLETWLFVGPIIKGINDHEVLKIIEEVSDIKTRIIFDSFHYYKGLKFKEGSKEWWNKIRDEILKLCKKYYLECHEEREDWVYEKRKYYKPLF